MKTNRRKPMAEINVVPYIDVMLVLLVIFMITAPLITAGVDVALPQVDAKPLSSNDELPLIASIDASGNYYLSVGTNPDQALEANEVAGLVAKFREANPQAMILINADKNVAHGKVVYLMDLLQKEAGVANVGIMTEPQG